MSFCYSTNGERFHGDFPTRDGAMDEAKQVAQEDELRSVWVGECVAPRQPEHWWNAEDWLEHVSCQDEYGGEWAMDWDESTTEQREELEQSVRALMSEWLDRHKLRPRFFNVDNIEEIKLSEAHSVPGGIVR